MELCQYQLKEIIDPLEKNTLCILKNFFYEVRIISTYLSFDISRRSLLFYFVLILQHLLIGCDVCTETAILSSNFARGCTIYADCYSLGINYIVIVSGFFSLFH